MKYQTYVAVQLWLYLAGALTGATPLTVCASMAVFWWNRRRVFLWMEGRDEYGRFTKGYSHRLIVAT